MDFSAQPQVRKILQNRLTLLVVLFVFFYSLGLTLAPLIKTASWETTILWQPWVGFCVWLLAFLATTFFSNKFLSKSDLFLIPIAFLLTGWGLLSIFRLYPGLGIRQTAWLAVSTIILIVLIRYPQIFELIRRYRTIWLVITFVLIGLTLLPGLLQPAGEPILWLSIGSINLQPSEPLKIAILIYLAGYFSSRQELDFRKWQTLIPTIVILIMSAALLILQRDLGTATLLFALYVFMIYTITPRKRILLVGVILLVLAAIGGYLLFDVIRLRAEAWINPWRDPTNRSYQIVQSLMAAASGGLFGTGPGMGSPNLVPVAVSDFIFAAIFEETGLLGVCALIILILLFFSRAINAARNADHPFSALLAGGLGLLFAIQSILIIGGNIRLFPLTGVTLPLVSYGGSSLLINMIGLGLLLRISNQNSPDLKSIQIYDSLRKSVFPVVTAGFIMVFILAGYWSVIRKDALLNRGDNLRRLRTNLYVPRGDILDSHDQVIATNTGEPGNYKREYRISSLASTVGYENLTYGLSGIESAYDPFLSGSSGYSLPRIWWQNLLTSEPPQGLDIRLTIDNQIQKSLADGMKSEIGAGVVVNAQSGEILAITSVPSFDANELDLAWNSLVQNPEKPLFNRALDGKYPAGTTVGVFLMAEQIENGIQLTELNTGALTFQGKTIRCTNFSQQPIENSLRSVIQASCPQANLTNAKDLTPTLLYDLYSRLGLYRSLPLQVSTAAIKDPGGITAIKSAAIGQENLSVSPLHMALAAASLSSGGTLPKPKLVLSHQEPDLSWTLFPTDNSVTRVFSQKAAVTLADIAALPGMDGWGVVGHALTGSDQSATWFIGGTNSRWQGSPVAVAILLERDDPAQAMKIGTSLIASIIHQTK